MREKKLPREIYFELSKLGEYLEANLDINEINKVKQMVIEDYNYAKKLRKTKDTNYRVIFNIHYDVLCELCDQLMRFNQQKISNHQGLFAFIVLNNKDLELDFSFFEKVRNIRNKNKYCGEDITFDIWNNLELQFDLHIDAILKEIKKRLDNA